MKKFLFLILISCFCLTGCTSGDFNKSLNKMKDIDNYKVDLTINMSARNEFTNLVFTTNLKGVVDLKNSLAELEVYNKYYGNGVSKSVFLDYNKYINTEYYFTSYGIKSWAEKEININNIIFLPFFLDNYSILYQKEKKDDYIHYSLDFKDDIMDDLIAYICSEVDINYYGLKNMPRIDLYINKKTNLFDKININLKDCINPDDYGYKEILDFFVELKFSDYDSNEDVEILDAIIKSAETEELLKYKNQALNYLNEIKEEIKINSYSKFTDNTLLYDGEKPISVDLNIAGSHVVDGILIINEYKFIIENGNIVNSQRR